MWTVLGAAPFVVVEALLLASFLDWLGWLP